MVRNYVLLAASLFLFAACAGTDDPVETTDAGPDAEVDAGDTPDTTVEEDTSNPELCGNGTIDEGELCEPFMLDGATCATEGFSSGTLFCNATCDGYDTSECNSCNNGVLDEGEQCDGLDFGGETCESRGFDGGMLVCNNCFIEISGCEIDTCGNGEINAGEDCDGELLAGETCGSQGFDGGTIGCTENCQFELSGCATCGDDVASGGESCDGDDFGGQTCSDFGFDSGQLACSNDCTLDQTGCSACGDGVISGDEDCDGTEFGGATCQDAGFDGGTIACAADCSFETSACTSLPKPAVGEIVFTEIMPDPDAISDSDGEWFEVFNTTGDELALSNCEFRDASNTYTVAAGTTVAAGAYFTVARSPMPGFTPDIDDLNFGLNNGGDDLSLWCDDGTGTLQEIDSVSYDGGPDFPDPTGASISLDSDLGAPTATLNDVGANYCAGRTSYASGDLGTPGAANESCAFCGDDRVATNEDCDGTSLGGATCSSQGFDTGTLGCTATCTYDTSGCADFVTVSSCHLESPTMINEATNTVVTVFGRVTVPGLTDTSSSTDTSPALVAELGYGPDTTDPATSTGWSWRAASANAAYDDTTASGETGVDEYQSDLVVPTDANSPYDYAYRFSGDGGATWSYCDTDETTPYSATEAGAMIATAPITPVLYFSQYIEGSTGLNKALEIYNGGGSTADLSLCSVRTYSNGSSTPNTNASFALSGTLAPGMVFTICHPGATEPGLQNCDLEPANNPQFNGNDAVELYCDGSTLDVIGQIGNDPGSAWSANGVSTEDASLTRNCSVTTGDTDGSDAFDPSVEWDTATDVGASVGSYTCP